MPTAEYLDRSVVGVSFGGRPQKLRDICSDAPIDEFGWQSKTLTCHLTPDPSNKYDPFAIKVIAAGHHVGFLPAGNRDLFTYLDLQGGSTIKGQIFVNKDKRVNPTVKLNAKEFHLLSRQASLA